MIRFRIFLLWVTGVMGSTAFFAALGIFLIGEAEGGAVGLIIGPCFFCCIRLWKTEGNQ